MSQIHAIQRVLTVYRLPKLLRVRQGVCSVKGATRPSGPYAPADLRTNLPHRISTASGPNRWSSPVMADNKNPNCITHDAKKTMIRKPLQVYPPDVRLSDRERFGSRRCFRHKMSQLRVELTGKLWSGHALVMPHQLPRRSICWSSCSNEMPEDGFASNSASRRRASARPSSSSSRTDGSDLIR